MGSQNTEDALFHFLGIGISPKKSLDIYPQLVNVVNMWEKDALEKQNIIQFS